MSLFNKYRPATFEQLVGQKEIAAALRASVAKGKVASTYLFSGPRGTGKTSAARLMAKALNCLKAKNGEPCGKCEACTQSSLDVIELDAASSRGIDDVRALREQVALSPMSGGKRIFILDEAHQFTNESWNALLKTLEEPPSHAVFILATTEPAKVPDTIHSRSQHYRFRPVPVQELVKHLTWVCTQEKIKVSPGALELIAKSSEGYVRDALVNVEQATTLGDGALTLEAAQTTVGAVGTAALEPVLTAVHANDLPSALKVLTALAQDGTDGTQVLRELLDLVRERFISSVHERTFQTTQLALLLEELLKAGELLVGAHLAYLPLELALYRTLDGKSTGSSGGTTGNTPARSSAPIAKSAPASSSSGSSSVSAPSSSAAAIDDARVRAVWSQVPSALKAERDVAGAQMCTRAVYPESVRGDTITLAADSAFSYKWVVEPVNQQRVAKLLSSLLGTNVRVSVKSAPSSPVAAVVTKSTPTTNVAYVRFSDQVKRFFEAS